MANPNHISGSLRKGLTAEGLSSSWIMYSGNWTRGKIKRSLRAHCSWSRADRAIIIK